MDLTRVSARRRMLCVSALSLAACICASAAMAGDSMVRVPIDSVGYATEPGQLEPLIRAAKAYLSSEGESAAVNLPGTAMIGAVCPHDDYIYAGVEYLRVMSRVRAKLLILIGVCHRARREGIEGKLIFDGFDAWAGPYGETKVSAVRDKIIASLPEDIVLVSKEMHEREHSLEAFIPFIQYPGFADDSGKGEGVEILPILVSRLPGALMGDAAGELADIIFREMEESGLELGADVAVLISADCVHYGDEGWGGTNYAPFGVDSAGYARAVRQDREIIDSSLTGPVNGVKISLFRDMVERDDLQYPYKVTWCGVYSIPFGLDLLCDLCSLEGIPEPDGFLLGYSTSIEPVMRGPEDVGLGATNIATLRHWVGYASIGYWAEPAGGM